MVSCQPDPIRSVSALRPDKTNPERFICERTGTRPKIPPEYTVDWTQIHTVDQAKAEHAKAVTIQHTRENIVAGYIIVLEGVNFTCFNNMTWQKDFYSRLPAENAPPAQ